ncbi:hypothetical protein JSO54_02780 [Riemerella anatipestifer]|uniref:hypothetical protein n=1 Tax=Riemerella anatipestifer TaxID=34085 RepID=UPI0030BCD99C
MKKSLSLVVFIAVNAVLIGQSIPPNFKSSSSSSNGLSINSRRSVLIEKQVFNIGKFQNLNFQKIVSKDISENSFEKVFGIMIEYETYDNISKRTFTIGKPELSKLIEALTTLQQRENEKIEVETKYKFQTLSNIEFGGVYNEVAKKWTNYIKFPSAILQNLNEFSKEELKDLIKLLKKVESEL